MGTLLMRRRGVKREIIVVAAAVLGLAVLPAATTSATARPGADPTTAEPTPAEAQAVLDGLPARFEANRGQFDPAVRFVARGGGFTLFLAADEAVVALTRPTSPPALDDEPDHGKAQVGVPGHDVVRIALSGANPAPAVKGAGLLPGVSNYFIGNEPGAWHTDVPSYSAVRYEAVYPGIDLIFHPAGGPGKGIEYDFEVAPGADPSAIAISFTGGGAPAVDPDGDLVLTPGASGELRQSAPTVYQEVAGRRRPIDGSFRLSEGGKVGFEIGSYDRSKALVIDPVLTYSTYLAGSVGGESGATDVVTGPSGTAYVTGHTYATNFPVPGAAQPANAGRSDRFVTKLNTTASGAASLLYSTYLGGTRYEGAVYGTGEDTSGAGLKANPLDDNGAITVDASGNTFITGTTSSADFPITAGVLDVGCGTDVPATCNTTDNTYADGETTDGSTTYQSDSANFFVADIGLAISGTNIQPGTTIVGISGGTGGSPTSAILSAAATGAGTGLSFTIAKRDPHPDTFVAKLNAAGSALMYSTYLGSAHDDRANSIALGPSGTIFVAGHTGSTNFPTAAAYDAMCGTGANCNGADHSDSAGSSTSGSTIYSVDLSAGFEFNVADVGKMVNGTHIPSGTTIAGVTNQSTITLSAAATGTGTSLPFTVTARTPQRDAFVAQVNATGTTLSYSTFLGGSGDDAAAAGIAVDAGAKAYVAGLTTSTDLPTMGAYQAALSGAADLFVTRLDPAAGSGGLLYSTYLGGTGGEIEGGGIAVDANANAYLTGTTFSSNFPSAGSPFDATASGLGDAFAAKVNTAATGSGSLVYSTYLGGAGNDIGLDIAIDAASPPTATLTGSAPFGFPQLRATQQYGGGERDAYVTQLNGTGSALVYSTFLGGAGTDSGRAVVLDTAGNPYVVGTTGSTNFPTTGGAYQPGAQGAAGNAFVTRLNPASDAAIITGASPRGGPGTGGTSVVITGQNLTGATAVTFGTTVVTTTPCPASPTPAGCFNVDSPTRVTAVSPACDGCTGANITVTTAQGTSGSTKFTYGEGLFSTTAPPTVCLTGGCNSVRLHNGKVLVDGGIGSFTIFDPATGTWSTTGGCTSPCSVNGGASLTLLPNGKILRAGGSLDSNTPVSSAYLYDPAAGTWTATGSMTVARDLGTATLLNSGKVLVAGGCSVNTCENAVAGLASAELYDPTLGTWAATGAMNAGRWRHTATLLGGPLCTGALPPAYCGRVVVAGGIATGIDAVTSAERYDPVAGTWATAGSMNSARAYHSATLLTGPGCSPNCGKVLVAGGAPSIFRVATSTAELYDPAASGGGPGAPRWTATGSMTNARLLHSAVALPRGKVLVAGESTANFDLAERYDPVAATWGSAGGLGWTSGRVAGAALLAPGPVSACGVTCGKVLVFGSDSSFVPTAGLYTPGPSVTSITPTSDCTAGAAAVTITGTGLAAVTKVTFGSVVSARLVPDPATPDTRLVAQAPPGVAGTISVKVITPGGESATATTADDLAYSATLAGGVPCAPQNATATPADTAATVTWSPPAAGPAPTGYTVTAVAPGATLLDGVSINNSTTYTSSSATFVAADVGRAIRGPNIPAGATIAARTNATTIVLSAPATGSGTNLDFTIAGRGFLSPAPVNVGAGSTTYSFPAGSLTNSSTTPSGAGYRLTVVASNASGSSPPATTATVFPGAPTATAAGTFTALTPARILDTRPAPDNAGVCTPSPCAQVAAGSPVTLQVTGQGGIPATGVAAVVMSVAVTAPSADGFLRVWPADAAEPNASNLNYTAGQTVPNLVTVKLSATGTVKISHNATGSAHVIADVAGYYADATGAAGSRFNAVTPARVLDTRPAPDNAGACTPSPCAQVAAGSPVELQVTGQGGVPVSGVTAVVMSVAVTGPSADGFLRVWPSDAAEPNSSNLNYTAGQTVPNLVTVKLSPTGTVKISHNATGSTHVIADVAGWYGAAGAATGSRFIPLTPARVLDTRPSPDNIGLCTPSPCAQVAAGSPLQVQVTGQAGVPATGVSAVVMSMAVTGPTSSGFLRVWPADAVEPNASNLNYTAGQTVPNLVAVKLSATGSVKISHNATGSTHVIADVAGWFNDGS